jgi:hypothetical protein
MSETDEIKKKRTPLKSISGLLNYRWILKNINFFIFLSMLAVLYIANGHMADNRIRKINDTGRKLKDLQYEYKTLKSEIMFKSRESEMVKAAAPLGLLLDTVPPVRIQMVSRKTN